MPCLPLDLSSICLFSFFPISSLFFPPFFPPSFSSHFFPFHSQRQRKPQRLLPIPSTTSTTEPAPAPPLPDQPPVVAPGAEILKRKRGRPRIHPPKPQPEGPKRPRGRPRKVRTPCPPLHHPTAHHECACTHTEPAPGRCGPARARVVRRRREAPPRPPAQDACAAPVMSPEPLAHPQAPPPHPSRAHPRDSLLAIPMTVFCPAVESAVCGKGWAPSLPSPSRARAPQLYLKLAVMCRKRMSGMPRTMMTPSRSDTRSTVFLFVFFTSS